MLDGASSDRESVQGMRVWCAGGRGLCRRRMTTTAVTIALKHTQASPTDRPIISPVDAMLKVDILSRTDADDENAGWIL